MSSVTKTLASVREALYKVGLKEPWRVTGAWSLPDFQHFLPSGHEYRKHSPGSQTVKAKIPHDSPRLVFDIKYFVRDHRRNNKYMARTVDAKTPFDFDKMFASAPVKPEDVQMLPSPGVMPTRGF